MRCILTVFAVHGERKRQRVIQKVCECARVNAYANAEHVKCVHCISAFTHLKCSQSTLSKKKKKIQMKVDDTFEPSG